MKLRAHGGLKITRAALMGNLTALSVFHKVAPSAQITSSRQGHLRRSQTGRGIFPLPPRFAGPATAMCATAAGYSGTEYLATRRLDRGRGPDRVSAGRDPALSPDGSDTRERTPLDRGTPTRRHPVRPCGAENFPGCVLTTAYWAPDQSVANKVRQYLLDQGLG